MKRTEYRPNKSPAFRGGALSLATLALVGALTAAHAQGNDNRAPDVPFQLKIEDGQKVHFHAYAIGVQIYTWVVNPTNAALSNWVFVAPEAVLFDADGDVVGAHYAGPTWESNSGSKVVAARFAGLMVDPDAIPWLLLKTRFTEGNGIFTDTTWVHRVNTAGGLPPLTPGTVAGQEARVDYTAEYFFYRKAN
jgi:hypothetical protein